MSKEKSKVVSIFLFALFVIAVLVTLTCILLGVTGRADGNKAIMGGASAAFVALCLFEAC